MKLAVEFPSVSYREGPAAVLRLAQAIERMGYDHIDVFDHVVMGVPVEGRPRVTLNATAIFPAGARSVEAITDSLARLHDRIRAEVG